MIKVNELFSLFWLRNFLKDMGNKVYQSFIARKIVKRKTAEERTPTSNVDSGCVEEKVSCSSVFIDLSVVSISGIFSVIAVVILA